MSCSPSKRLRREGKENSQEDALDEMKQNASAPASPGKDETHLRNYIINTAEGRYNRILLASLKSKQIEYICSGLDVRVHDSTLENLGRLESVLQANSKSCCLFFRSCFFFSRVSSSVAYQ